MNYLKIINKNSNSDKFVYICKKIGQMLKQNILDTPDALEVHMMKKMDLLPRVEMSQELFLISGTFVIVPDVDFYERTKVELQKIWQYQAIQKRIEHCLTIDIDHRTIYFIISLCEGNIGCCIQYIYYTQYLAKKKGVKHISFEVFLTLYPHGFFTFSDMNSVWRDCKVEFNNRTVNLIDFGEATKSIQYN